MTFFSNKSNYSNSNNCNSKFSANSKPIMAPGLTVDNPPPKSTHPSPSGATKCCQRCTRSTRRYSVYFQYALQLAKYCYCYYFFPGLGPYRIDVACVNFFDVSNLEEKYLRSLVFRFSISVLTNYCLHFFQELNNRNR